MEAAAYPASAPDVESPGRLRSLPLAVVGRYVVLVAALGVTAAPFGWSLYTALTYHNQQRGGITFSNFGQAWNLANFNTFTLTTVLFSAVTAIGATLVSAIGGYAFARLRFPGRRTLFGIVLSMAMVPASVVVLPLFLVMVRFPLAGGNDILGQGGAGFYNTFMGLVLPGFVGTTSVFLMRQFFLVLPREFEEAARIDGSGEWRIFWRIMLPLARPGLITVFVLQFQDSWNAYLWPLVIANSQHLWTLQVGLASFQRLQVSNFGGPGTLQAAAVLVSFPIIVLYLFAQKSFRRGIALTGFK